MTLCIRFVRDLDNQHKDDIVTVKPDGPNFSVTSSFLLDSEETCKTVSVAILSRQGVMRFVEDMIKLACMDSLPFASVQMDFPLAPTFCFDITNGRLEAARDVIVRMTDTCLSSWPEDVCLKRRKRHRFE